MAFTKEFTQGQELLSKAQGIAKKLRARKTKNDFKGVILGLIAYRLYSENFVGFLEEEEYQARKFKRPIADYRYSLEYSTLADDTIAPEYIEYIRQKKGYFILPSELYSATFSRARKNLRKFTLDGQKVSIDKVVYNFFKTVEEGEEPLFSSFFADSAAFGAKLKDRSAKITNLLVFVDGMNYEIIDDMLELLV